MINKENEIDSDNEDKNLLHDHTDYINRVNIKNKMTSNGYYFYKIGSADEILEIYKACRTHSELFVNNENKSSIKNLIKELHEFGRPYAKSLAIARLFKVAIENKCLELVTDILKHF